MRAEPGESAQDRRRGRSADHRRSPPLQDDERRPSPLGPRRRRLLAPGRRAVDCPRGLERPRRPAPRGRRDDADRRLLDRQDDVRQRPEPGRPLPLPPPRLRRLVERGSTLADVQHLPARPRAGRGHRSARPRLASGRSRRAYRHFAVIEFNMRPVVPGRGSGIFLHARTGSSTNGCVSLPVPQLVSTLRWLDPAKRPRIVIGTRQTFRRL